MESYKQKYKEAKKLAMELYNTYGDAEVNEYLEKMFPELKESEDEKIRKWLICGMNALKEQKNETFATIPIDDAIAWLERQGKNKDLPNVTDRETLDEYAYQVAYDLSNDWLKDTPTWNDVERACKLGAEWNEKHRKPAWSKEDEEMCQETIDWFEKKCFPYALESENPARESIKWLKSLKTRVHVQPKQEWSEQEQIRINRIVGCLENLNVADNDILLKDVDWLKSLKGKVQQYSDTEKQEMFLRSQRPHFWRPSDEQMEVLLSEVTAWTKGCPKQKVLESLYNELKNLK